jgi:Abnormal spindle-like microcephaly-assoc'd, ASPM-SPD-2-Hydin
MQTSKDGGVTWSDAERITTAETDEATGAEDNQQEYGDYIGLTAYAGSYFACWTDRRSNSFEQIWGAGFKLAFLVTSIANSGRFGNVCVGAFADEILTINNSGSNPLYITGINSSSVDFLTPSVVAYPMVLGPGSSVDVVIRFEPKSAGVKNATITIFSSDPTGPHKIKVSGDGHTARLSLVIADKGFFGKVCVRSFVDKPLVINNSSRCALLVTDITSSLGDFVVPEVLSYPLAIGAGDSLTVPIRFEPTVAGLRPATVTVISTDPASPHNIKVSGDGELSRLTLMIADKGHFGKVCVGSHTDEPLILNNSSSCALSVSAITSSSAEFEAPEVLSYPLVIAAGNFLPAPIRFRPTSFGQKSAEITVVSTDPASPHVIKVEGHAPPGRITITGSTTFGGVNACCCADRTISICNVGDCALHVASAHFKRKSRHWKLLHNPFPAKLPPGSCLPLVIQYRATEKCSRSCELVIESDDPVTPVKIVEVLAYTIWNWSFKADCDDCRKGCCDKGHREPSCQQGYPCCCEDDEDDDCKED